MGRAPPIGEGIGSDHEPGVNFGRHSLHALTHETVSSTHYFRTSAHEGALVSAEAERMIYDRSAAAL